MDWLDSDRVETPTRATVEEPCFLRISVSRGYKKTRLELGASRRRSEFADFSVQGDNEGIRLCQEGLVRDLEILQVCSTVILGVCNLVNPVHRNSDC
jgi:hypothetical protein